MLGKLAERPFLDLLTDRNATEADLMTISNASPARPPMISPNRAGLDEMGGKASLGLPNQFTGS